MAVRKASWEGGPEELQMLQAAMSESYLILHGPPDLPRDAEILGVCGVSAEDADQNKYGWMVADFLHWKLLFHDLGEKTAQTWASSLNIPKFLENIDGVDTNDETVNDIIGKHEDAITTMPNNNQGFKTMLIQNLTKSAHAAVLRGTVLAVMVFAPVTPEQDICLDLGGRRIFVTVDGLYRTINEAVGNVQLPIIILTPSPFTGGWSCRSINPVMCPGSDQMMRIIAKSSGGAFAKRFIRSFTEKNSPLITDSQRANITYDDPMPLGPTALQTDALHHFQRQIHESLEHRLSVFARDHAFILRPESARDPSVFSDTWAEYGPRLGLRFERWAERWGSTRPTIDHPDRFEFLGEAFGGTKESQLFHLTHLITTELATNRGDWGRQVGGGTGALYASFLQQPMPTEDEAKRVFDAIEFRASSVIVAQMVVKAFALPVPDGFKCRYWHDKMDGVADEYYRKLQCAFGETHGLFDQAAVLPSENQHEFKNVRFFRAARWLSAAIALRFENGSREEIKNFISRDVSRFIRKIQDTQKTLLLEDKDVIRAGTDWIAALGLSGGTPAATHAADSVTDVVPAPDDTSLVGQASAGSEPEGQAMAEVAPDYLDTQTAMDDWINKAWGLVGTPVRADKPELESKVDDGLGSFNIADPPKFCFQHNGTERESSSDTISNSANNQKGLDNDSADAWGTATGTSVQPPGIDNNAAFCEAIQNAPVSFETANSVPASFGATTSVPNTSVLDIDDNISAWDEILNPPTTSSRDQQKRQARVSFQESDDLLDLEEQGVDEPVAPTWTAPATEYLEEQVLDKSAMPTWAKPAAEYLEEQVLDKPATPTLLEPAAIYLEEKTVDKPATPIPPELAAKSPLHLALARLAEALKEVSREMSASKEAEAEYIAQVFKKAAQIIEEDEVVMAFRSRAGSTAVEKTSFHSPASLGVDKDSDTWSKWLEAASPRPNGNSNEKTRTPSQTSLATSQSFGQGGIGNGKAVARIASEWATSPNLFDVSPKDHLPISSPNVIVQSWATQNPTGTSPMEHASGIEASRTSTDNTESTQSAIIQAATTVHQPVDHSEDASKLLCGNDFWARAGFKF